MIKGNYKRVGLDGAREVFRQSGAVLLASEYKNNATAMPYLCKCGAHHKMSLAGMKKGGQCPDCSNKRVWEYESVQKAFSDAGCVLKSTAYKNMNAPLEYVCKCGTESKTTFGNFFHKGARCFTCGTEKISGSNAHQYKPEKTDEERTVQRKFPGYREWREAVYARDDYTCQCCGSKGKVLNAHHLDNYADHKELRVDVANGVTLCKPCHKAFHAAYGQKTVTTKSQFAEFLEQHHA